MCIHLLRTIELSIDKHFSGHLVTKKKKKNDKNRYNKKHGKYTCLNISVILNFTLKKLRAFAYVCDWSIEYNNNSEKRPALKRMSRLSRL